jgi:hypothetical protein
VHAQCPPPAVSPELPHDSTETTNTKIHFRWTPTEATGYTVYAFINGSTTAQKLNKSCDPNAPFPDPDRCVNASKPDCCAMLAPGHYEWFVRHYTQDCPKGAESEHRSLQIQCTKPVAPTKLWPDDTVVPASGTTLTWEGGCADAAYDVFIGTNPGDWCPIAAEYKWNPTPLKKPSLETGPLTPGAFYTWSVGAWLNSSDANRRFSSCATFNVACVPPGNFKLGEAKITGTAANLQWGEALNARWYTIYMKTAHDADFKPVDAFVQDKCTSETNARVRVMRPQTDSSKVEWYVVAHCGDCEDNYTTRSDGKPGELVIPGCRDVGKPESLMAEVQPGDYQSKPVKFSWKPARNADDWYRLMIERPEKDQKKYGQFQVKESIGISTSEDRLAVFDARPPGTYKWYVEASLDSEVCGWVTSQPGSFTVK